MARSPLVLLAVLALSAAAVAERSAAWNKVHDLFVEGAANGDNVSEREREGRSGVTRTAEDLFDAAVGGRLEWATVSSAVPINCSLIPGPNDTLADASRKVVGFFHIVLPSADEPFTANGESAATFVVRDGEDIGVLEAYLPLLNKMGAPLSRLTGGLPMLLEVSLASRASSADPLFATVDFSTGRFIVNREILGYLPASPPSYLVSSYEILESMLDETHGERLTEDLPAFMVRFMEMFQSAVVANPAACFFCIVIFAPFVTILANIVAAWYGQQMCIECELSESMCSAVVLYMLQLVYQNLPLLAAILFKICEDVCVVGATRIASLFA